jgi:hypothetical protein
MLIFSSKDTTSLKSLFFFFISCLFLHSCNITRKAPKGVPYLYKNTYEVNGGRFTKLERTALLDRLANQLDDSSRLRRTDALFFLHFLKRPPAYDTGYSALSANNMKLSMYHLGYYNSTASFKADTSGRKVSVHYTVMAGNPTLIDTFSYRLGKPDIQQLAQHYQNESIIEKGNPITKGAVLGEIGRLVDTLRNRGYYKFTAAELRMRADTSIAALTTVSDDPFEQLQLLAEAQQKRDSPEIKLALVLNNPQDSSRLNQYTLHKIYILPDHYPGDNFFDTVNITQRATRSFILRYHQNLFRTSFLARNITLRPGNIFRQDEYNRTLSNLAKAGVWQSVNIQVKELPDSSQVDLILELVPENKFGFETALEASYSATSNTSNALTGNLIGLSANFSLVNRNIGREAIRMTHRLRAGVEFNNNSRGGNVGLINSNELSYSNNVLIPRNIPFLPGKNRSRNKPGETFINTNLSLNNRLRLFNLQSVNLSFGKTVPDKKNTPNRITNWTFRPLNLEFSYLFNQTDSFKTILKENPFLQYSYNTSFVIGMAGSYSFLYRNPKHLLSLARERSIKINAEESGLTPLALLPILNNYKREFIKLDAEYKYTVTYPKTVLVLRAFAGVGVPILFRDTSLTLPFFKQFFGGGINSMRGWPVRGIGRGSQPLPPYQQNIFNDRTGDMQIELNAEYRYDIARIIPNLLTLRGAVFVDAGNVWNIKNSKRDGSTDSAQFKFKNFYREMGLSAGTGFRLDFNYVVLRFDLGFRFKRPETSYINDGWKLPDIGFNDFLKKIFTRGENDQYRRWRYENFNFTIGIGVPFQ